MFRQAEGYLLSNNTWWFPSGAALFYTPALGRFEFEGPQVFSTGHQRLRSNTRFQDLASTPGFSSIPSFRRQAS